MDGHKRCEGIKCGELLDISAMTKEFSRIVRLLYIAAKEGKRRDFWIKSS